MAEFSGKTHVVRYACTLCKRQATLLYKAHFCGLFVIAQHCDKAILVDVEESLSLLVSSCEGKSPNLEKKLPSVFVYQIMKHGKDVFWEEAKVVPMLATSQ